MDISLLNFRLVLRNDPHRRFQCLDTRTSSRYPQQETLYHAEKYCTVEAVVWSENFSHFVGAFGRTHSSFHQKIVENIRKNLKFFWPPYYFHPPVFFQCFPAGEPVCASWSWIIELRSIYLPLKRWKLKAKHLKISGKVLLSTIVDRNFSRTFFSCENIFCFWFNSFLLCIVHAKIFDWILDEELLSIPLEAKKAVFLITNE